MLTSARGNLPRFFPGAHFVLSASAKRTAGYLCGPVGAIIVVSFGNCVHNYNIIVMAESEAENPGPSGESTVSVNISELIAKLDAKWERRFGELSATLSTHADKPRGKKRKLDDTDEDERALIAESQATTEQSSDESEDEILAGEVNELHSADDKTGPAVPSALARVIEGRFNFANKLSEDKVKEKMEAHPRPSNCESLTVPQTNFEVWSALSQAAKHADLKFAAIQRAVMRATSAVAQCTTLALEAKHGKTGADLNAIIQSATDAITLLGHASRELTVRRRAAIKPQINKTFSGICNDSVPATNKLFGDNLTSAMKDARDVEKLGAQFSSQENRQKSQVRKDGGWRRKSSTNRFLGQKGDRFQKNNFPRNGPRKPFRKQ